MATSIKKIMGIARNSIRKLNSLQLSEELFNTSLFNDASLKAYYRFNSGGLTTDSKNSYTLTNNGTVTEDASGIFGYSATLGTSNTTKYLFTTNPLDIDGGACSINMWVKLTTELTGAGRYQFVHLTNNTSKTNYQIFYEYNGGSPYIAIGRNKPEVAFQSVTSSVVMGTSNWYMLTLSYNNTDVFGYINGVSIGSIGASGSGVGTIATGCYFGYHTEAAGRYASCIFDDVSVFNRYLTDSEVPILYQSQVKKFMGVSNI